jgi:hypothetical protein
MTYTVRYRREGQWFWRKLHRVKGDGFIEAGTHRFFICEDETRHELPIAGTVFEFSNGRFLSIKQRIERETGQKLPIGES